MAGVRFTYVRGKGAPPARVPVGISLESRNEGWAGAPGKRAGPFARRHRRIPAGGDFDFGMD